MARTKATPLRRQESSEYTSSADRTPRAVKQANGHSREAKLMKEEKELKKTEILVPKGQAGVPQLIMAVGGIYISL